MTRSVSGEKVRADHPAAPTLVPRVGEERSTPTGESPGGAGRQDRPVSTFPSSADEIAARLRAVVSTAARPGWPGRVLYALANISVAALSLAL